MAGGASGARGPASPRWSRSAGTVATILDATTELVDRHGVGGVHLADIAARAGVGTSSIYHFFGSRSAVIATALIDRFDRTLWDPAALPERDDGAPRPTGLFDWGGTGPGQRGDGAEARRRLDLELTRLALDPDVAHQRRLRMTALGAAARNGAVLERIGASLRRALLALEGALRDAIARDEFRADVSARALAQYLVAHQLGLVSDELDPDPVPRDEWLAVIRSAAVNLVEAAPDRVAEFPTPAELPEMFAPIVDDPIEAYDPADLEAAVLRAAADAYRARGSDGVSVDAVRRLTGVSGGWFHRHFGDRDGLLDSVRVDLCQAHLDGDVAAYRRVVGWARTPAQFVGSSLLAANLSLMGGRDPVRWDMIEALAACAGRPMLRRVLGSIEHRAIDGFAAVLADGRARGLLAEGVPLRAASRFLLGYHFGLLLGEVAGLRPTPLEWRSVIEPILWALTPVGWAPDGLSGGG